MVVNVLNGLNSNDFTAVLAHLSAHGTSRGVEQMVHARHTARGQDQPISPEEAAAEDDIASALRVAQQQLGPFVGTVRSGGVTTRQGAPVLHQPINPEAAAALEDISYLEMLRSTRRDRRHPPVAGGELTRRTFLEDRVHPPRRNTIINAITRLPTVISYFESEVGRPDWQGMLPADQISSAPTASGDDGVDRAVDSSGSAVWRPSTDDKCITTGMICPITQSVFVDPVVAPDGHTYERSAIKKWFAMGKNTSPVTNESFVGSPRLLPNHGLRNTIEEIVKKNYPEPAAAKPKKTSENAPKGVSKRKHRSH